MIGPKGIDLYEILVSICDEEVINYAKIGSSVLKGPVVEDFDV